MHNSPKKHSLCVCVCVQLTHKLFLMFKFVGKREHETRRHALWVELLLEQFTPTPKLFKLMTPKSDLLMTCSPFLFIIGEIICSQNYLRLYTDPASPGFLTSLSTMAWRLFLQTLTHSKCFLLCTIISIFTCLVTSDGEKLTSFCLTPTQRDP